MKEMPSLAYPYSVGPFNFPADEGSHPGFTEEWWYLQSHFISEEGTPYAFVVSYVNPGYRISALIDLARGIHHSFVYPVDFARLERSESRHDVRQGASWWRQNEEAFCYELHEEMTRPEGRFGSLHLDLRPKKPPVPIAGGIVSMGRNGCTYWYALTSMRITGAISIGEDEKLVEGTGWLDRQWGNWNWMGFGGWKWFAVHLEDERDIVAFHIYEPISSRPIARLCQIIADDGSPQVWDRLEVEDLGSWTSPDSNDVYTCGWQIKSRPADLDLRILPAFDEQEIHRGLWEGSCTAEGHLGGERVSGMAFVEQNTGRLAPTVIKYLSYLKAIGMGLYERSRRGSTS